MSCLLGIICNQSERLAHALAAVRAALVAPAPISRWGLSYAHSGEILLSRTPHKSARALDMYPTLADLRSDCLVAHASGADGLTGNANTQPFRYRQWMFAQQTTGGDWAALASALREDIPAYLQRRVHGQTLAEVAFHHFLAQAHSAGCIDDPNSSPTQLVELLATTLARVRAVASEPESAAALGPLVLSNGRVMVAACPDPQPALALHLRRLTVPLAGAPRETRDPSFRGLLVLGTSAAPEAGFETIPPGSCVLISRDLSVDISAFPN
ncbi:MAG: hypothetical protein Tsb0020_04760 [Haliangiales bacterium]